MIAFEGPATIAAIILETIVRHRRHHVAAARLPGRACASSATSTASSSSPTRSWPGSGAAGEWFAVDLWDVMPDLITFAKGVNSGYVPLGGVAISDAIAATFDERAYPGGLTYSGHPLACAAAVATINVFEEEGIVEQRRATWATDVFGPGLAELADRHPSVGEVRGLGVFWALELVKRPRDPRAARALQRRGRRRRADGRVRGGLQGAGLRRSRTSTGCTSRRPS